MDPGAPRSLPGDLEAAVTDALGLEGEAREAALERLRAGHPDAVAAIDAFVAMAAEVASAFRAMPRPASDVPETPDAVGPYRVDSVLGQGGMGTVYLAEQSEPVKRRVALKVIKLGMDSAHILARFEIERQVLAAMNHDHIAKVYDAGLTERGQPYFAMEYVEGQPLDRHCDERSMSTRERLQLFLRVCEGVQHAHQRGVIHRDLKPSNILVSMQGERAVPKIIDFGLARAVERSGEDATFATFHGQLVGTPGYMSPEQAAGDPRLVDTRTDVYSLGVVFHTLLVGALPIDPGTAVSTDPTEYRQRVQREAPRRPSSRLSKMGAGAATIAQRRGTEPRALLRLLRGDLDWIAMRALDPELERRYASVAEFAEDVRRHLRHEPVRAVAPTAGYRLRKFARRHRVGVAAGTAVAVALFAGVTGTLWQAGIARQRLVEIERALKTARSVNDFLTVDLLAAARPEESLGRKVTVEEVLKLAALEVGVRFAEEPEIQAAVRHAIGETFSKLGLFAEARDHLERAFALRSERLGPEHADTLATRAKLGSLKMSMGDAAGADETLTAVLAARERLLGPEHDDTLRSHVELARLRIKQDRYVEAEEVLRAVLEVRLRTLGERDESTVYTMARIAQCLEATGRWEEADVMHRRVLMLSREVSGDISVRTLDAMNNLAVFLTDRERYDESERVYDELLRTSAQVYGDDHPEYSITLNNWATLVQNRARKEGTPERFAEAEDMFRRVLAIREKTWGPNHSRTATALNNLGVILSDEKEYPEAEAVMRRALAIQEQQPDLHPRDLVISKYNIAAIIGAQGDNARAVAAYRALIPEAEEAFGSDDWILAQFRANLGMSLESIGDRAAAERELLRAHAIADGSAGPTARVTISITERLRNFYRTWNELDGIDKRAELDRWEGELQERQARRAPE